MNYFCRLALLCMLSNQKIRQVEKKKNFAFVCYKHECSVPYSISLLNSINLCGRGLKVQSRYLQALQAQGLASLEPEGIHTLEPYEGDSSMNGPGISRTSESRSLMGQPPLSQNIPGNIAPHILALANQQMGFLNAQGMVPLCANPSLNARMQPRNDRHGSINYNNNNPNNSRGYSWSGQDMSSNQEYNHYQRNRNRGPRSFDNKNMQSMITNADAVIAQNSHMVSAIQDQQGRFDRRRLGYPPDNYNEVKHNRDYDSRQNEDRYNRDYNSRQNEDRYKRHYDSRQNEDRYKRDYDSRQNEERYKRDYDSRQNEDRYKRDYDNRHDDSYRQNREFLHKSSHHDYRQQPYDRNESHHSRQYDRHTHTDSRRRFEDKSRNDGRNQSYNSDRHGHGGEYQQRYNSRH